MSHEVVGSVLRCRQAFAGQICERVTLDFGIAFFSETFPSLPEANQFREVVMPPSGELDEAFEQARRFFAERRLEIMRWAPVEGVAPAAMQQGLARHGFLERVEDVFRLARWEHREKQANVRILPARAMRAAFDATFSGGGTPDAVAALERDAFAVRLDDPSLDMFVAIRDGNAVGRCGLHQVGDVAHFIGPVASGEPRATAADALVAHVLALAQRLNMRLICATATRDDAWKRELLLEHGFEAAGQLVEFDRADASSLAQHTTG